jgi:EmrB/QacA subfamily drug resistance transporter
MQRNNKNMVLVAMVFAVAMIFIDQTIVVLAIPSLQHDLHLSPTGSQWVVNGYLLAISALFALGGRVSDVVGHRRVLIPSIFAFALFSALCGATPTGSIGQAWIIFFRVLQGASAAFLFPSALATVVATFPVNERGKALATFFSISGGLTSIGPIAGGYLTQWTWRSIFWINVPVAIIAIVLTLRTKPTDEPQPSPIDTRGALLIGAGMGLSVLGLQQVSVWGWSSPATWLCLIVGLLLLAAFTRFELRIDHPLVPMHLFRNRAFAVDNIVLLLLSVCFVPLFFFSSIYAQVALGKSAQNAGFVLLVFFIGFVIGAQIGGRVLDNRGARPTVVAGCAIAAVGFYLWGNKLTDLSFNSQWFDLALSGVGIGLVLGPVSTDALNRASRTAYGAVTGLTQTVRNFGGSLGLAVLGSILITQVTSKVVKTLTGFGVPSAAAHRVAHAVSGASGAATSGRGNGGQAGRAITHAVQLDFAHATRTVIWGMAGAMAVAFVAAVVAMPRGKVEEPAVEAGGAPEEPGPSTPQAAPG